MESLTNLESKFDNNSYGLLIIIISIITRIFTVSIAWSYGTFLVALKKSYPNSYYSELGWIAGLAQGFGSIISPSYIWLVKRFGYKMTFLAGLSLCSLSMIASSYTTSEHHLFFTYSLPFGIGSSIIFVIESLLAGLYFPPSSKYHVGASAAISLGFPLGFLILSPLTETLIVYFDYDWKIVQRIYGFATFFQLIVFTPLFTEKYSDKNRLVSEGQENSIDETKQLHTWTNVFGLRAAHLPYLTKFFWLMGIFLISCGNNSVQINLNGFFETVGIETVELNSYFIVIGASDCLFRILLSLIGRKIINNLCFCYIIASLSGVVISVFWTTNASYASNILICFIYGVCPAVTMSLMYSINSELYGFNVDIDKEYTLNVMISGFGIFFGPIITGYILDATDQSYQNIFVLTGVMYFIAAILFAALKIILIKNSQNNSRMNDYEAFENEEHF